MQFNPYMPQYGSYVPQYNNRFQQPEQQYQQYSQPSQQSYPQNPQTYPQVAIGLQGKLIDNADVVKVTDIPLDGSISYFPLADGSAILTKQLQTDGTSKVTIYKPSVEVEKAVETPKYVTEDKVIELIQREPEEVKELKEEIRNLKRQLRDMSEDLRELREVKDTRDTRETRETRDSKRKGDN